MESTKSFIKVYNITPEVAEDFEFDYSIDSSDILGELAPDLAQWEDIAWMELEDYEYDSHSQQLHLTLSTKWEPPVAWLRQVTQNVKYFQNKLSIMATIQKDETCVTGVAVMDGEILQNKNIFAATSEEVGKYYDDDYSDLELDELDNRIWDSIGQFNSVCEKFYLGGYKGEA